jgi:hypothetical protein
VKKHVFAIARLDETKASVRESLNRTFSHLLCPSSFLRVVHDTLSAPVGSTIVVAMASALSRPRSTAENAEEWAI